MEPRAGEVSVRYIKLGEGGLWERECLEQSKIRIGFGSARPDRFAMCRSGQWDAVRASFVEEGSRAPKNATNQLRHFFEDDGSTLWITFIGQRMYYGRVTGTAEPHPDGRGVARGIAGGWNCTDANGEPLTTDRLSGAVTMLTSFPGTSCAVRAADYVDRRIRGVKTPQMERAERAVAETKDAALDLLRMLTWADFEVLVDLVFSASGWRRVGPVGRDQKTIDFALVLPTTGERAFVQVKSKTTPAQLAEYVAKFRAGPHDRMFFAYHSGQARTDMPGVDVLGPERLIDLVMDAGLVSWLMGKAS
jgi:hypothetical protein